MKKDPMMSRLKKSWLQRNEEGAGALLPIIVVGVIIITVAALVNLAVTYSSKISTAQLNQSISATNNNSLLSSFESDIYGSSLNISGGTTIKGSATVTDFGSYTVYYSTATAAPTSTSSTGVTAVSTTIPSTAKWIMVVTKPTTGTQQTSVFAYQPKATAVYDSAINWSGSVNLDNYPSVENAQGVTGPTSIVTRESSSTATTQNLSLDTSEASRADVWASYSTAKTEVSSNFRGNIVTKSAPNYIGYPKIYGDVTTAASSAQITGNPTVLGTTKSSATLTAAPGRQALKVSLPTTNIATLTAADCSTPALLEAKLESFSSDFVVKGVNNCDAASWTVTIKPNANLILDSSSTTALLTIKNLTITGPKSVSIHSPYGVSLNSVKYIEGAKGQILSGGAGASNISNSTVVGAVANYGTAGGSLLVYSSKIFYSPIASNLCTNSTTTTGCTAISSTGLHLTQVS